MRGRLLRQPAFHVLGLRPGRRVVPALPDRLRRHPWPAVRRRARRAFAVAVVHQRAQRVSRELFPAAHRYLRDDRRIPAAPGRSAAATASHIAYRFLEPGEISIHDDRWFTYPWGVNGGLPGARSRKMLENRTAPQVLLPSQVRPRQGRAGGHAALHHLGRRRVGRAAGARPGAGCPGRRSRARDGRGRPCLRGGPDRRRRRGRGGHQDGQGTAAGRAGRHQDVRLRARPASTLRATCEAETGLPAPQPPVFR